MSEEIFFEVGARIAALRGAMKQSEFAERLGVNRQTVGRWEAGERLPDGTGLLKMREEFGASVDFILTGHAGGAAPALRPDEEELLANYRMANSDGRERLRQISATAANSPKRTARDGGSANTNSGRGAVQVGGDANGASINTGISIGRVNGRSQITNGDITNHGPITFGVSPPKPKKTSL